MEEELIILEEQIDQLELDLSKAVNKYGDASTITDSLAKELTDATQKHHQLLNDLTSTERE